MSLSNSRKALGLSQRQLAEMLTAAGFPATQGVVSMWERGDVVLTAERCAQIERVTGGEIRRVDLRPDLFGAIAASEPSQDAAAVEAAA
jgi:DNA-binding transcriptional regulator YdaS (Cro superfamily)